MLGLNIVIRYSTIRKFQTYIIMLFLSALIDIMTSKAEKTDSNYVYNDPYSNKNISVFELIFGESYISPGGEESATYFSGLLELKEGQKVLDVACGCGGPAFLMARYFDSNIFPASLHKTEVLIPLKLK